MDTLENIFDLQARVKKQMLVEHGVYNGFDYYGEYESSADSQEDFYKRALKLGVIDQEQFDRIKKSFNEYLWTKANND